MARDNSFPMAGSDYCTWGDFVGQNINALVGGLVKWLNVLVKIFSRKLPSVSTNSHPGLSWLFTYLVSHGLQNCYPFPTKSWTFVLPTRYIASIYWHTAPPDSKLFDRFMDHRKICMIWLCLKYVKYRQIDLRIPHFSHRELNCLIGECFVFYWPLVKKLNGHHE